MDVLRSPQPARADTAAGGGHADGTLHDPLGDGGLTDPLGDPIQRAVDVSRAFANGTLRVKLDPVNSLGLMAGNKAAPSVDALVTYTPTAQAPDADPIRLVQIVRTENPSNHAVGSWAGGPEARRDKTQTETDDGAGVQGGWFVDHTAEANTPRNKATDAVVPDAYVDASKATDPHADLDSPMKSYAELGGDNQHGRKAGEAVTPAKLKDQPASTQQYDFRAEVVVKGKEAGGERDYGQALWSFDTEPDGDGGQRLRTHVASFPDAPSANYQPAIDKYNEVYRNPGASTSPEEVARLKQVVLADPQSEGATQARAALRTIFAKIQANALDNESLRVAIEKATLEQAIGPLEPQQQGGHDDDVDSEDGNDQDPFATWDDDPFAALAARNPDGGVQQPQPPPQSLLPAVNAKPDASGTDDWANFDDF